MFSDLTFGQLIIVIVSIFLSMSIHEAMHAFTAHWLGDTTAKDMGRLTLNPLKHIDLLTTIILPVVLILFGLPPIFAAKPVPFNPNRVRFDEYGAALVGIAGPLTNFVLAGLGALIIRGFGASITSGMFTALELFVEVNVAFFVFNMIPFPPLDGSRLLYAFAPEPVQKVMYRIESLGFLPVLAILFIGVQFIGPEIVSLNTHLLQFLIG
jgi:Zn-dependent protease